MDLSLHTGVHEEPRPLEDKGFGGMSFHETHPSTTKEPNVPFNKPSPLENRVEESADTQKASLPAPSGSFARRTS